MKRELALSAVVLYDQVLHRRSPSIEINAHPCWLMLAMRAAGERHSFRPARLGPKIACRPEAELAQMERQPQS